MKRFVTYLYEYDRGVRGRNTGFVRTDIRDNLCRMELHIRGLDRYNGKVPVYLVVAEPSPVGVDTGELLISRGSGSLVLSFPNLLIKPSPYSTDQLQALVIRLANGKLLAGCYVKEPVEGILRGNFDQWTKDEAVPSQTSPKTDVSDFSVKNESRGIASPSQVTDTAEAHDTTGFPPETDTPMTPKEANFPTEPKTSTEGQGPSPDNGSTGDVAPLGSQSPAGNRLPWDNKMPIESVLTKENEMPDESVLPRDNKMPIEPVLTKENEMPNESLLPRENKTPDESVLPQGNEMSAESVLPQPETSYRRIELTDIRSLPRRNWYLSNNRFVVHGFFNYHYLLLKTVKLPEGRKRYIGVPGIYEQPERMMALLFGFPEFELSEEAKRSRPQPDTDLTGTFGYWMRQISEE